MKIALVLDDFIFRPGGIQEYVLGLGRFLREHGHEVSIICGKSLNSAGFREELQLSGVKLIELGVNLPFRSNFNVSSLPLPFLVDKDKLQKILEQDQFDILHFQAPFAPTLSGQILKLSRSVNVATFHVFLEETDPLRLVGKTFYFFQKELFEKIDGWIAISRTAREMALEFFQAHYQLIPLGINLTQFNTKILPWPRFKDGKINLLFVGRLEKRKGVRFLLKAYQILMEKYRELRLIIVGAGSEESLAREFIEDEGFKNVVLAGRVSPADLPRYYASADVFISTAIGGESFGLVLLEAMATGLPIVAFNNRGYQEILNKINRGFLVKNKSATALATAVGVLIENPALREELGQLNLSFVQKFSWEKVGRRILSFYEDLLGKNFSKKG